MLGAVCARAAALLPGASHAARSWAAAAERSRELELTLAGVRSRSASAWPPTQRVCGFTMRDQLPATYPHVLAFPLQLALMADAALPVRGGGARAHREPHHAAPADPARASASTCSVRATALQEHPRGSSFALAHRGARRGRTRVWEESSTMLREAVERGAEPRAGRAVRARQRRRTGDRAAQWRLRARPRPPLRRRVRRPQPDPHARAEREGVRVSARRSPTACGAWPAAWPRSRVACPTHSPSRCASARRSCCPRPWLHARRHRRRRIRFSVSDPARRPDAPRRAIAAGARLTASRRRVSTVNTAERSMGVGLRALNQLARLDAARPRWACASRPSDASTAATTAAFATAAAASRTFKAAPEARRPARQQRAARRATCSTSRPTRSSRCCREAIGAFAAEQVRPAASAADAACATPPELLAEAGELGRHARSASPRSSAG